MEAVKRLKSSSGSVECGNTLEDDGSTSSASDCDSMTESESESSILNMVISFLAPLTYECDSISRRLMWSLKEETYSLVTTQESGGC